MENLIGVGNNKNTIWPDDSEKSEIISSETLHGFSDQSERPDPGNIFNLYMFEQ